MPAYNFIHEQLNDTGNKTFVLGASRHGVYCFNWGTSDLTFTTNNEGSDVHTIPAKCGIPLIFARPFTQIEVTSSGAYTIYTYN